MPVFGVGWSITSDEEILRREPNDQHYYLASVEAAQTYVGIGAVLRKASVARVDRRLRRYYLFVRLLPNVFALADRSLGSIYYDTGSPRDGKTPFGWLHPCRLVTDSRRLDRRSFRGCAALFFYLFFP